MTKFIDLPTIPTEPQVWHWTLERYHQAIDIGFLTENDQVELLFGTLIVKMPVGKRHAATFDKISDFLPTGFAENIN